MIVVTDFPSFSDMLTDLATSDVVGFDIETTGLDPHTDRLLLLSFAASRESYVIDMGRIHSAWIGALRGFMENPNIVKVIHNAVFDTKFMYAAWDITVRGVHCTLITEQLLKAGLLTSGFTLADVAMRRLGIELDKSVREAFINRGEQGFTDEELLYSAKDAEVLLDIYRQQMEEVRAEDLTRVYDLEMSLIEVTMKMEYSGVCVDVDKMREALPVIDEVVSVADRALQEICLTHGAADYILFERGGYKVINTASPKQVLAAFSRMGIDVPSLNKKDLTDWDSQWAMKHAKETDPSLAVDDGGDADYNVGFAHPVLRRHAIRTAAAKLSGTYITGLLATVNPTTGRIHPGFRQCGAVATGRFSSNGPNLQNLPNATKLSALGLERFDVRSMFIPAPGRKFIISDYSGIELVILAAMSGDHNLIDQILRGDIHTYVANTLFAPEIERATGSVITKENKGVKGQPWKLIRDEFKRVSYGVVYGSTGWNLYRTCGATFATLGIHLTQDECDRWVNEWKHTLFPETGKLLDANAAKAITKGYTQSILGRRRRWDTATIRSQKWLTLAAMREGMNQPIQSSSADMTKTAMVLTYRRLDRSRARIALTVHDELVVEAEDAYVDEASVIVKGAMEDAGYLLFPDLPRGAVVAEPKVSERYDK